MQVMLTLEHLNHKSIEKAPRVDVGFIIQELANKRGLRVGHVTRNSRHQTALARLSEKPVLTGQEIVLTVTLDLPPDKHIYSLHREGFGIPTSLNFRGHGYQLLGITQEPMPGKITGGIEPMWILEGRIQLVQKIRITDARKCFILVDIQAQVCDVHHCHALHSAAMNDGSSNTFFEFRGDVATHPPIASAR
jgi:hypothetical protein